MTALPETVRTFAAEVLKLASALTEAEAIQWSPAPIPRPREDTTERAKGGHGDPTLAIVLDDRRLAVRAEVEQSHAALAEAVTTVRNARRRVEAAVDRWNGEDGTPESQ